MHSNFASACQTASFRSTSDALTILATFASKQDCHPYIIDPEGHEPCTTKVSNCGRNKRWTRTLASDRAVTDLALQMNDHPSRRSHSVMRHEASRWVRAQDRTTLETVFRPPRTEQDGKGRSIAL